MAQRFVTDFVINGDASGGVRAFNDTNRSADQLNRTMQTGTKRQADFAHGVGGVNKELSLFGRLASPLAPIVAGIFTANTLKSTLDFADQVQKVNLRIGASTEFLSEMNYVASQSGVQFNEVATALQRQTRRMAEAAQGGGPAVKTFKQLGLSAAELSRLAPEAQFEHIAAALRGVANESDRVAMAQKVWDSEGVKLLQIVNQGANAIDVMRQKARDLGLTISNETANAMAGFNDQIDTMGFAARGLAQTLLSEIVPGMTSTMQATNDLIQDLGGAETVVAAVMDGSILLSGVLAGRLAGALGASTLAVGKKMAADRAATLQAAAVAQQERETALATARRSEAEKVAALNSARVSQQRAQAAQAEAAAKLREITVNQELMASERALETQRLQAQISATGRQQSLTRLAEIRRQENALIGQSAAAQKALQAAELQAASSTRALTAAKNDATRAALASNNALAASTGAARKATTAHTALAGAARASRLAMAPLGGPLGVAVVAASAFMMLRDSSDDLNSSLIDLEAPMDRIIEQFKEMNQEAQQASIIRWGDRIEEEADKAESAMGKIRRELANNLTGASIWGRDDEQYDGYRRFLGEINDVADGARNLTEVLDEAQGYMVIPDDVMRRLRLLAAEYAEHEANSAEAAETQAALRAALEDVASAADNAGDAVNGSAPGEEAIGKWEKYNDQLRESIANLKDPSLLGRTNRSLDGMGIFDPARRASTIMLEMENQRLEQQKKAQADAAKANTAAASAARKRADEAQREAQRIVQAYESQADKLKEQIALFGETGDAAKLRYEIEHGKLQELSPEQKAHLLQLREELDLKEKQAKATEDFKKRTDDLISTYDRQSQQSQKLKTDIEAVNAAYADPAVEMSAEQHARMLAEINHQQYMLALESETTFAAMATAWENSVKRMDDAGVQFWRGFLDGTGNAMDQFKRLVLDGVAEVAHALITRPLVVGLQTQMAGGLGLGPGGQPGAGGGLGLGDMGSLKSGWQAVQSGLSGVQWTGAGGQQAYAGGGWANAATQGTGATGYWGGSMQNFQGTQALASAGTGLAGGYAGTRAGESLFGKNAGSSYGATGGAIAGTYFGGPAGAALGGAIGGAIDAAFGKSKKTFDFDFEQGKHSYVFGDGTSAFGDYGLTGLSDYKLGEQQDALKELLAGLGEFDNQIAAIALPGRFKAINDAIDGFTHSGAGDLFETRLRAMITGGEVWAAEAVASVTDPEKLSQAMLGALQLEQLGGVLGTELSEQIKAAVGAARGDYAADVVQSTLAQAQAAGALIDASSRLNLQFDQTAAGALSAAGSLAQYVGGVDSLTAANNAYYQAAFSEQERLQHSYDDVRQSLGEITGEAPRTVGELRALVEAQSLNGDASQRLAADLMALAPALKETTAAVRQAIEQQYQDALGRAPAGDGLDYWFNLVADGSLTLEGALWNIANSAEATAAAANGAASGVDDMAEALRARDQLERQLLQAQGKTDVLRQMEIDRLSALEAGEVDNLAAMQRRLYAIEDEKAAQQAAERAQQERTRGIEREAQAWSRARDQLAGFGNSISGWVSQRDASENGGGPPRARLEASDADFWAQYEKALGGDRNAQQGITQYADRAIDNLESYYASSAPGQAGIAEIRDAMARLPDMLSPEQFLAEEFRGVIGEQTVSLVDVLDLNGSGTVSALEQTIAADWSTTDKLASVLNTEMNRLGTTVLTKSQIRAALKPHATDAEIDRLIKRVDVNGDGVINRQELTNARLSGLSVGIANAVAGEFGSIDVSGDGFIDYSEFRRVFEGMATDSELRRIFDKLDVTGTGTISRLDAQTNELVTAAKSQDLSESQRSIIQALNAQQTESVVRWWGHHYANELERKFSGHQGLGVSLASKQDPSGVGYMAGVYSSRVLSSDNVRWLGHTVANEFKRAGVANGGNAYAKGGVFSNSIVDTPTFFNESLMGEAGPEAIVPLSRGAGGRLGIDASGLMTLPEGPLQLPPPNLPPPSYPLLNQSDVIQVLRDVQRELVETRKQNKTLHDENTRLLTAANAQRGSGFLREIEAINEGNSMLKRMQDDAALEGARR